MEKENIWLDQLVKIGQRSSTSPKNQPKTKCITKKLAKDYVQHLWKVVDLLFSEPALFVLEREDLYCHHLFTNLGSRFVCENILFCKSNTNTEYHTCPFHTAPNLPRALISRSSTGLKKNFDINNLKQETVKMFKSLFMVLPMMMMMANTYKTVPVCQSWCRRGGRQFLS